MIVIMLIIIITITRMIAITIAMIIDLKHCVFVFAKPSFSDLGRSKGGIVSTATSSASAASSAGQLADSESGSQGL